MKRIFILLIIPFIFFNCPNIVDQLPEEEPIPTPTPPPDIQSKSWQVLGDPIAFDNDSAHTYFDHEIQVDNNNIPYVAYNHRTQSAQVVRLNNTGTSWERVGNSDFSADIDQPLSMILDSNGRPVVAFQEGHFQYNNKATVMRFAGNSWVPVGEQGCTPGGAVYPEVTVSSTGTIYLAYHEDSSFVTNDKAGRTTVMCYHDQGNEWEMIGSRAGSAGRSRFPINLGFNSFGDICYFGTYENPMNYPVLHQYNYGTWDTQIPPLEVENRPGYSLKLIGRNNSFYLLYMGYTSSSPIASKYMLSIYNNGIWQQIALPNDYYTFNGVWLYDMDVDSNGVIYLLVKRDTPNGNTSNDSFEVVAYENNKWSIMGKPVVFPYWIRSAEISVSDSGIPYVVLTTEQNVQDGNSSHYEEQLQVYTFK